MSDYGKIVKELRLRKNWSQRQLALNANISNTEISRIESGSRDNPSIGTVKKLAKVFGITAEEFLASIGKSETIATNNQPKDLAKFLNQTEVMFDGEMHSLNEDEKKELKTALEFVFYKAKERNKRKKKD